MLLRIAAPAAALALLAGCGGAAKPAAPTSGLPSGCEVAGIQRTVTGFLDAWTRGRGVGRFVAAQDDFTGFAISEPDRRFRTLDRAAAVRFVLRRHRYRETVHLLQMVVARGADENHVAVRLVLGRVASDLPARGIHTHSAVGDGVVACLSGRLSRFRLAAAAG